MKIANYVNLREVGWNQILVKAIERRISSKMTSFYIYIYLIGPLNDGLKCH